MQKMFRRWLITIGIIVLVLIIIGVLYENGVLDFEWQGLTMIFAALAAPYTIVKKWLEKDSYSQGIEDKYEELNRQEVKHRTETDIEIKEKELKIEELEIEIKNKEKEVERIEHKKKEVKKKVEQMSLDELQEEGANYFGS